MEGNGSGYSSDHGGIYILNAGTEGGVGLTLRGVQMERNRGEADVYIAGLINANTSYNIHDCAIFPIDATDFTTNRIFFENGVHQHLNLSGNSFKHYGAYTPSAARKTLKAANPNLLSINLMGDIKQFYAAEEFPTGLGAMGMSYGVRVNSSGAAIKAPSGWGTAKIGAGVYEVSAPSYINAADFAWSGTAEASPPARLLQRVVVSGSVVTVVTSDTAGTPADSAFSLTGTPI